MLIELWEKMRGYDKWVETEAFVEESLVTTHENDAGQYSVSDEVLVWADTQSARHRAAFAVGEDSALYQLVEGSTLRIRYNPADPEEFYIRELVQTRVRAWANGIVVATVMIGIVILAGFWRSR